MDRDTIIREILSLPTAERAFIVDLISASFADGLPPQLNPADHREMLHRIEMYEKHPETFESWDSVKGKLAERRKAV